MNRRLWDPRILVDTERTTTYARPRPVLEALHLTGPLYERSPACVPRLNLRRYLACHSFELNPPSLPPHPAPILPTSWLLVDDDHFTVVPCLAAVANTPCTVNVVFSYTSRFPQRHSFKSPFRLISAILRHLEADRAFHRIHLLYHLVFHYLRLPPVINVAPSDQCARPRSFLPPFVFPVRRSSFLSP